MSVHAIVMYAQLMKVSILFFLVLTCFRWRSALLWRTFFTTAVVAIVLRAFMEFCATGKCGLFGKGGLIMYDVSSEKVQYSGPDVLAVILLGIIGGIFGSLYNYLVDKVLRTYSIINKYVTVLSYLITAGCFFF
jgi:chloride channel 7